MEAEAVKIEDLGIKAVRRTCASGATISKGALLALYEPNTINTNPDGVIGMVFGGIAAEDKISTDGKTNTSAHLYGVFDITAGCTISMGALVIMSGGNVVCPLRDINDISGGKIVGKAEESATAKEVIRVRLGGM